MPGSGFRSGRLLTIASCLLGLAFEPPQSLPVPPEPPHPVPLAAPEQPPVLGLPDLERLALQHNPTLAQAALIVEASRGKAVQAGLCPNPVIGYVGDQINAQGTAGELQGGFIQQTIITGGKLRLSRAKYTKEASEAEARAVAQELRVVNGVRCKFYELLAIQRMIELHQALLRNAEESLRTHKEMFNTGQANQAEVLLVEIEVNRACIALKAIENRYQAAWQELVSILGVPHLPHAPLQGRLEPDGPPLEWEPGLARLLQDSPELQAARLHVERDQVALAREQVQPIPNVSISASTGRNYETSNTVAGVQIGLRIPLFDRNQGTIQQARADLARSYAEVNRIELYLRQHLADVFRQYRTAVQTATMYHDCNIPKSREALEIMKQMYEKRRIGWIEVVKLERNLLLARADYTHSLLELRKAEVAITGLLLVDGLNAPRGPVSGGHLDATPKPR